MLEDESAVRVSNIFDSYITKVIISNIVIFIRRSWIEEAILCDINQLTTNHNCAF